MAVHKPPEKPVHRGFRKSVDTFLRQFSVDRRVNHLASVHAMSFLLVDRLVDEKNRAKSVEGSTLSTVYLLFFKRKEKKKKREYIKGNTRARGVVDICLFGGAL